MLGMAAWLWGGDEPAIGAPQSSGASPRIALFAPLAAHSGGAVSLGVSIHVPASAPAALALSALELSTQGAYKAVSKWARPGGGAVYRSAALPLLPAEGRVTIPPGSTRTVWCHAQLPSSIPPTFGGTAARYSYAASVRAVAEGGAEASCRAPFRVLAPSAAGEAGAGAAEALAPPFGGGALGAGGDFAAACDIAGEWSGAAQEGAALFALGPPPEAQRGQPARSALAVERAAEGGGGQGVAAEAPAARIVDDGRVVVDVAVQRNSVALGGLVTGTLDFAQAEERCRCLSMVGALLTREVVQPAFRLADTTESFDTWQAEVRESTVHTDSTHFILCVPPEAPTSFRTDLVALEWWLQLTFELEATLRPDGSVDLPQRTLTWEVPIQVGCAGNAALGKLSTARAVFSTP